MNNVKRYRFHYAGGGHADAHLDEEQDGNLVAFDDYAAVARTLSDLERMLEIGVVRVVRDGCAWYVTNNPSKSHPTLAAAVASWASESTRR